MKKSALKTFFAALALCLSLFAQTAHATCTCEQMAPELQEQAADAVFIGTTLGPSEKAGNGIWTTFSLETMKKQSDEAKIIMNAVVMAGEQRVRIAQKLSNCNFMFEAGKKYIVYAIIAQSEKGVGYLSTGQCAGTKEFTEEAQTEEKTEPAAPELPNQEPTETKGQ